MAGDRCILAFGPVDALADRAIRDLIAAARTEAPEAERRIVDLSSATALGELTEALSPSLFATAAAVIATNAESIADDSVTSTLLAAVHELPPDTWLAIRHLGGVKGRKIAEQLKESVPAVIACDKPNRAGLDELITDEFRRHDRRIASDGRAALRLAVGDDVGMLFAAVEQLVSDVQDDPVTHADVMTYYGGVADMPGYLISDAVWDRRKSEVVERMRWAMRADPGISPAVTSAVAGGARSLGRLGGVPRGASDQVTAGQIGAPPFKVRQLRRTATDWSSAALGRAIRALAVADAAVKGRDARGRILVEAGLDPEQGGYALEQTLLTIADDRGTLDD